MNHGRLSFVAATLVISLVRVDRRVSVAHRSLSWWRSAPARQLPPRPLNAIGRLGTSVVLALVVFAMIIAIASNSR